MKDKILFLTQSYPEISGSASTLCTHRVMRSIEKSGEFEVHAVCYKVSNEKEEELIDGIHIHRFKPSIYYRLQKWISVKNKTCYNVLGIIQKVFTIPFYPYNRPISTHKFYKKAREITKELDIKNVVSEFHGLDSLTVGLKLVEDDSSITHIPILWDPIKGQRHSPMLPHSFSEKRVEKLEKRTSDFSAGIISMKSLKNYYKNKLDTAQGKRVFLDIPGIIPPDQVVGTEYLKLIKKDYINIIYSGLLTIPSRNPIPVIDLINKSKFSKKINLIFFCNGNAGGELTKASEWFKGEITTLGYIPLPELHTVYSYADYLLNISDVNANMTPSKIFEYMSYGKPIISTYVTEGDAAANYLNNYPESLCLDLNMSDNNNTLLIDSFLSKQHRHVPFEIVRESFMDNTPDSYVNVIKSMMNNL